MASFTVIVFILGLMGSILPVAPTQQTPPMVSDYEDEDSSINQPIQRFHQYYNSTLMVGSAVGQAHWVDMAERDGVKVNYMPPHDKKAPVDLSFDFPFYGQLLPNVTIAKDGFLYTGVLVVWGNNALQYVAPLMANFEPSIKNDSFIKYVDNGTAFTVQWEKVVLHDRPNSGEFTFQATLHQNGDIVLVYQSVPDIMDFILDDPVRVGISDAYIVTESTPGITGFSSLNVNQYSLIQLHKNDIKNWTVIYFNALPTCAEMKDCYSCNALDNFYCTWCPAVGRCSNGLDRKRQEWLSEGCSRLAETTGPLCEQLPHGDEQHPQVDNVASPHPGVKSCRYQADERFMFVNEEMKFIVAKRFCEENNMTLASFSKEADYNDLVRHLERTPGKMQMGIWVGAMDIGSKNEFTWVNTGQPLTFTKWHKDEPNHSFNNKQEKKRCVALKEEFKYKMINDFCSTKQTFVCEKPCHT